MDPNTVTGTASADDEILFNFNSFVHIYKSGRVERFRGTDVVPPPTNTPGLLSKDVRVSSDPDLSARLFLPLSSPKKLPLLIYIHGGAFCIQSPFSTSYTNHLSILTTSINCLAVSLQYRLAPEHRLPAAYDDVWSSVKWIASHRDGNGPEPWLNEYADFNRVFLAGSSAGANLANDVAICAGREGLGDVKIEGMILVHPYFGSHDGLSGFIEYLFPTIHEGGNEARIKPMKAVSRLATLGCKRVAVFVAEKDELKGGGVGYVEALRKSGWKGTAAELAETAGEGHVFYMSDYGSDKAVELVQWIVDFVNRPVFDPVQ